MFANWCVCMVQCRSDRRRSLRQSAWSARLVLAHPPAGSGHRAVPLARTPPAINVPARQGPWDRTSARAGRFAHATPGNAPARADHLPRADRVPSDHAGSRSPSLSCCHSGWMRSALGWPRCRGGRRSTSPVVAHLHQPWPDLRRRRLDRHCHRGGALTIGDDAGAWVWLCELLAGGIRAGARQQAREAARPRTGIRMQLILRHGDSRSLATKACRS
jgi:hypothetical protein